MRSSEVRVVSVSLRRVASPSLQQVGLGVPSLGGHTEVDVPVWNASFGLRYVVARKWVSPFIVTVRTVVEFHSLAFTITSSLWREVATVKFSVSSGL